MCVQAGPRGCFQGRPSPQDKQRAMRRAVPPGAGLPENKSPGGDPRDPQPSGFQRIPCSPRLAVNPMGERAGGGVRTLEGDESEVRLSHAQPGFSRMKLE